MDIILILRFAEKLLALLGALLCVYLGYRLFVKGVSGEASLKAEHNKFKVQLLNAAPGIFFALFGMAILGLSVWRQTNLFVAEPTHAAVENVSWQEVPAQSDAKALRQALEDAGFVIGPPLKARESGLIIKDLEDGKYRLLYFAGHGHSTEKTDSQIPETDEFETDKQPDDVSRH